MAAVIEAAPHALLLSRRRRTRKRLRQQLCRAEAAHSGLLARIGVLPEAPLKLWQSRKAALPMVTAPPSPSPAAGLTSTAARPFYGKELVLPCCGVPVRAHADVPDAALWVAADRVGRMLRQQSPAVRERLRESAAAVHVVGRRQGVSDLPEHAHLRKRRGDFTSEATNDPRRTTRFGVWAERSEDGRGFSLPLLGAESLTVDERTRGLGGLQTSCGEENLLALDLDPRYPGRDVLSHEFAHTLMDFGLPPAARTAIEGAFNASVEERGLWRRVDGSRAYAATNAAEYFAE